MPTIPDQHRTAIDYKVNGLCMNLQSVDVSDSSSIQSYIADGDARGAERNRRPVFTGGAAHCLGHDDLFLPKNQIE